VDSDVLAWFHGLVMGVGATLFFDHFLLIPTVRAWHRALRRRGPAR